MASWNIDMDPASRNSGQRNSHFFIELAVSPRLESVECPTNIKLQPPFIPSFSPTQNMMPTVWRKDSKEVISNKIVMKPSHCMKWFLKNLKKFKLVDLFVDLDFRIGTIWPEVPTTAWCVPTWVLFSYCKFINTSQWSLGTQCSVNELQQHKFF